MPKKTREEKKLSEYRKRMMLLHKMANTLPSSVTNVTQVTTEKGHHTNPIVEEVPKDTYKSYFLEDFKKSLMFISIIITLEIIIYFASMNGYFVK